MIRYPNDECPDWVELREVTGRNPPRGFRISSAILVWFSWDILLIIRMSSQAKKTQDRTASSLDVIKPRKESTVMESSTAYMYTRN
jgi:hypothetical protein